MKRSNVVDHRALDVLTAEFLHGVAVIHSVFDETRLFKGERADEKNDRTCRLTIEDKNSENEFFKFVMGFDMNGPECNKQPHTKKSKKPRPQSNKTAKVLPQDANKWPRNGGVRPF